MSSNCLMDYRVTGWEDENLLEMRWLVVLFTQQFAHLKMCEMVHLCYILFTTISKYWERGTDGVSQQQTGAKLSTLKDRAKGTASGSGSGLQECVNLV